MVTFIECQIFHRTKIVSFLICLSTVSIFFMNNVNANPLPPPQPEFEDGSPYLNDPVNWTNYKGNLSFIEEHIDFTVKYTYRVYVNAVYVFKNKGSDWVNTTIALPFINLFSNLTMYINNDDLDFSSERFYKVPSILKNMPWANHYLILFRLSLKPYDTVNVTAKYWHGFSATNSFFQKTFKINYLSKTGALWPDPIKNATFRFFIPKELFNDIPGLAPSSLQKSGNYFIVTKSYHDWVPKGNIQYIWYKSNYGSFIAVLLLIILIVIMTIGKLKYRKIKRLINTLTKSMEMQSFQTIGEGCNNSNPIEQRKQNGYIAQYPVNPSNAEKEGPMITLEKE